MIFTATLFKPIWLSGNNFRIVLLVLSSASPGMQFGGDYGSRMRFWRRFFESDVEEEILVEDDLDERYNMCSGML